MATKCAAVVFLVLVALATVSYNAQAANADPGIVPPDDTYNGLTYEKWEAKWWQAAFSLPVDKHGHHPLLNGGAFGGEDGVVFLSGVGGQSHGKPTKIYIT